MKKVLFLCQQQGCPIELSPARYQLIHELKKLNYEISVYIPERISNKGIRNDIDHIVNTTGLTSKYIRNRIEKENPRFIIAFTYEDTLVLYTLPHVMKKSIFIYFNLEIYTPSMEWYLMDKKLPYSNRYLLKYLCNKIREIIYTRQCKLFVIQDGLRKRTCKKYFIAHENTILVPNSYILQEEIQTGTECSGIVYSGGFNELQTKTLIDELDKLTDIPITFAGWSDKYFQKKYNQIHSTHPNIKVCIQRLSPEHVSTFLRQYAIGLIWYTPTKDENINNIGLASGKLFKHLSLGQPVIALDCPGITTVIMKYKLGMVIHNVSEIKVAYECIMEQYLYYQQNVRKVYQEIFDYKKVIDPFLRELEKMGE